MGPVTSPRRRRPQRRQHRPHLPNRRKTTHAGRLPRPPPPEGDDAQQTAQLQAAWRAAADDLKAGKYADALLGYTTLMQQFGNTALYRSAKEQIAAGRHAAQVGVGGPAALLRAKAAMKKGRLAVEYSFDRADVFEADWSVEEPFATGQEVNVTWKPGYVHMRGASGMFLSVVFERDVTVEAVVQAEVAKDIGLLAVEESDDYRALILALNNSKFRLKKGAGVAQPGHLLWLMGKGVWGAADDDYHGYIKIAERTTSKLENGDHLTLKLVRDKDNAEGRCKGASDAVVLRGRARGDDGSGLGPARVGLYTWGGMLNVQTVRISGTVDRKWFAQHLAFLVALDPGPP